ncbi:hypothetical protein BH10PSE19_BH10PSE19_13650 [soil metagenome]
MFDWTLQSILIIQLIALVLLLFPKTATFCGLQLKTIVLLLLFMACIGIAIALYLHSGYSLNLYY